MPDRDQSVTSSDEARVSDRRAFLKTAGKAAATAPAVALLLSAAATPASAHGRYGGRESQRPRRQRGRGHAFGKKVARKKASRKKVSRKKASRKKAAGR